MKIKLNQGISAKIAVASLFSAGQLQAQKYTPLCSSDSDEAFATSPTPILDDSVLASQSSLKIKLPPEKVEFGPREEKEFKNLVILRATKKSLPYQDERFQELKEARESRIQRLSPDEVLADYRHSQMILQAKLFLLNNLKRG